jgi:hypothetical protein
MDSSLAPQPPLPNPPHQGEGTGAVKSRTLRLRFSLRTLLVLVTLLGFLTYWQTRPAQLADRFVAAILAGNYAAADQMFHKPHLAAWIKKSYRIDISARREPASLLDWVKGVSRVSVVIEDRSGWDHITYRALIEVTRRGLRDSEYVVRKVKRGPRILPTTMTVAE